MSKLFKRSLALLAVLTLLFALAVPTVLAESTDDSELPDESTDTEELPDESTDTEVTDETDVPGTGDFADAGMIACAAVVIAAGAVAFTMKKAHN